MKYDLHIDLMLTCSCPIRLQVPGAVAGWCDALERWGSGISVADVLAPAVQLAERGFPVSPVTAYHWQLSLYQLQNSALTDLYVQDQLLGQVKKLYLPSDELMGMLKK